MGLDGLEYGLRLKRLMVACATALVLSVLLVPMSAFASTKISVEGVEHTEAASGQGSSGGTWQWDGADALALDGYVGGRISADGALDITLTGSNVINYDADADGGNTALITGTQEGGALTIEGKGSLTIHAKATGAGVGARMEAAGDAASPVGVAFAPAPEGGSVGGVMLYGIYSFGDLDISGTTLSINNQAGEGMLATLGAFSSGATNIVDSEVRLSCVGPNGSQGLSNNGGLKVNHASVDISIDSLISDDITGASTGINSIGLDIGNGSNVNVSAKALGNTNGIYNFSSGHFVIADSTVTISTQSQQGQGVGMLSENMAGDTVDMVVRNSNVVANGSTAALWVYGKTTGSRIVLDNSTVASPEGAAPQAIELEVDYARTYGHVLGTGTNTITSLGDPSLVKSATIKAGVPTPGPTPGPVPGPTPEPVPQPTPVVSSDSRALAATGDSAAEAAGACAMFALCSLAIAAGVLRTRRRGTC